MTLLESTRTLLNEAMKSGWTLRELSQAWEQDEEKAKSRFEWLRKFTDEKPNGEPYIANPGINHVQSLHDCLKKLKRKSAA